MRLRNVFKPYVAALLFLASTAVMSLHASIPIAVFSRDPLATMAAHPLTGIQSNLGVLVWCATATICLFSGAVLRRTPEKAAVGSFLLWSGVITAVLLLDDLFMIHEDLVARYVGFGEKPLLMLYLAAVAWHLVRFRSTIAESDYPLLLVALGSFASSVFVDVLQHYWDPPWRIFLEDGFKLLGIVGWGNYLIRSCFLALAAPLRAPQAAGISTSPEVAVVR